MQKSDELAETASLLFKQINDLGIQTWTSGFNIWEQNDTSFIGYNPTPTGEIAAPYHIPSTENSFFKNIYEAKKRGEEFLVFESAGESLAETYNYMKTLPVVKQVLKGIEDSGFQLPTFQINHCAFFSQGFLLFITLEAYPDGHNIFKRFAKVFEQTYTRFLDLQKAEAQAREAKIEAALERIRSTAMAMHSSEGILEVTHVLREQIALLGEKEVESILVHIYHEDTDQFEAWYSYRHPEYSKGQIVNGKQTLNWSKTARARKDKEKYYEKETDYTIVADRKMLKEWYEYLFKLAPEVVELNDKGEILVPDVLYYNYSKISGGTLLLITNSEASDHSKYLLTRAATVFNLAYSRFLDLQKAEAQAREAKIEVALERVRSRAMAMQNSDELSELVAILFEELVKLDLILARCIIWIFDADTLAARVWMANSEDKKTAESYFIKRLHHPYYEAIIKGWKERNPKWVFDLGGPYKKSIDELLLSETELSRLSETVKMGIRSSTHTIISGSFNNFGFIEASGPAAHSEEQLEILNRFGKVFDLSYTRFNDLKQAEAQAREAKVEASLERVRGKAMAMHSSEDLAATIIAFYHELELFSITPRQCGVGLLNKESRIAELSTMNSTGGGSSIELIGKLEMTGHPVLEGVYDNWLVQKEYHPVLRGNEVKEYYYLIRPQIPFPDYPDDEVQYGYFFFFPEGGVYAWTEKLMGEEELKIYRRFTSVLNLTYKRYKDLQQAETNAREAVKQAALDRVRAEIASMRTTNDLEKITPLIWNELTIIGIPFIRCGVFIMDDSQKLIRTFLSTPKGKAIAAFHLPYGTPGNIAQVLAHWQNKKNYIDHWDEAAFTEFAATLVKQGALLSPEQYLEAIPRGGFYLHFLPFLQGMLYVGNTTRLVEQEIKLIQSVADAFSTAYARYEDFNKLEAAKQQVDETLADLKQAQTQLIQSEKMASLGELTAGIAHEIQNPLNFVNNFSEVNTELIDEMKSELAGGNGREAMNIADNIKENEQKINHHGKRADAIVKGMLQHSRASGGQKELTNINVLADEYLRLSYHGLRAKDKSFNADFKTDFDEMIGLINIVPQDIGRVLLNLYNNAFYAVAEKKKQQHNGYEPIISVGTKKLKDKIEITVKDNGNGMPQKVLDKIFQPFFTTKPTGQGTGLGLSLSYDVIKSHGGEIKAETKEGEGTEFVVVLPVDQR